MASPLIEPVAAIVILGVIVAAAVPVFRDLRYEARTASLERIRATMIANMKAARFACLSQGLAPGNTVRVDGGSIPMCGEGVMDLWNDQAPPDALTGVGMMQSAAPAISLLRRS